MSFCLLLFIRTISTEWLGLACQGPEDGPGVVKADSDPINSGNTKAGPTNAAYLPRSQDGYSFMELEIYVHM